MPRDGMLAACSVYGDEFEYATVEGGIGYSDQINQGVKDGKVDTRSSSHRRPPFRMR